LTSTTRQARFEGSTVFEGAKLDSAPPVDEPATLEEDAVVPPIGLFSPAVEPPTPPDADVSVEFVPPVPSFTTTCAQTFSASPSSGLQPIEIAPQTEALAGALAVVAKAVVPPDPKSTSSS
jgi:hypothetical protein